jgi:hypothetical protein
LNQIVHVDSLKTIYELFLVFYLLALSLVTEPLLLK